MCSKEIASAAHYNRPWSKHRLSSASVSAWTRKKENCARGGQQPAKNCGGETDSDADVHIGDVPAEGRATSGETQVQRVVFALDLFHLTGNIRQLFAWISAAKDKPTWAFFDRAARAMKQRMSVHLENWTVCLRRRTVSCGRQCASHRTLFFHRPSDIPEIWAHKEVKLLCLSSSCAHFPIIPSRGFTKFEKNQM